MCFNCFSLPFADCQNYRCFFGFLSCYSLLLLSFILSLFLCVMFGLYSIKLPHNEECETVFIQLNDSIQCGEASSLQYSEIEIKGAKKGGDTLQGDLHAWLVNKKHLKLYSELQHPAIDDDSNITKPIRTLVRLQGWQIYTWVNSIIYGYCCITNYGTIEQTATLYMFTSFEDSNNFLNRSGARNAILSDSIKLPPDGKEQRCFTKWGPHAPFTVRHNSYHFIGVDIPANSSFTSNITVLKTDVNTTDYGTPHLFKYDSSTKFPISFSLNENFIVVCKAPLYGLATVPLDNAIAHAPNSDVGSTSLHIRSCNEPYHWMKTIFKIVLTLGIVSLFCAFTTCTGVCICQRIMYRNRFVNFCKCHNRRRPRYSQIQEQDNQTE